MKFDPKIHHRRSIRLQGYDYSQFGGYFVTVCTYRARCLFGEMLNEKPILNKLGRIVDRCWREIPYHFSNVELDECVVMPNHLHGIIMISSERRGTACRAPTREKFGRPISNSLPTIIRSFRSAATKFINEFRDTPGFSLWQRNYYEHVIRDDDDLNRIREYILINPLKWDLDPENPSRVRAPHKEGRFPRHAVPLR